MGELLLKGLSLAWNSLLVILDLDEFYEIYRGVLTAIRQCRQTDGAFPLRKADSVRRYP